MGFNIPEKMQNWHTWEDVVKDSDLFFDYLSAKHLKDDYTFLAEVDDFKKVAARLEAELDKLREEGRPAWDAHAVVANQLTELYKMIDDWDKFENLLASDTVLTEVEKSWVTVDWKEQRARRIKEDQMVKSLGFETIKVVECLGSEIIEDCIKRKRVEVSEARSKVQLLEPRVLMIGESVERAEEIQCWIKNHTDVFGLYPPPPPSPWWFMDNMGSSSSPVLKRS